MSIDMDREQKKSMSPEYLKLAGPLLLQNILASVFALITLTFFGLFLSGQTLITVVSICGGIILVMMGYSAAWQAGHKDYNKVKFGHMRYSPYKGLISGAISQIPLLFLAIGAELFGRQITGST
jgi:hypothetical protein